MSKLQKRAHPPQSDTAAGSSTNLLENFARPLMRREEPNWLGFVDTEREGSSEDKQQDF
jgi:hypothetical protein